MSVDPLAEHAASWLLRLARSQIEGQPPPADLGPPPASLRTAEPTIVVLTTFNGRSSAGFTGRGDSLLDAVRQAAQDATKAQSTVRRLALDIGTLDRALWQYSKERQRSARSGKQGP